jgi:hypothetical protein
LIKRRKEALASFHPPAYQPPIFVSPFPLSHIYIWRLGRGEGWYAGGDKTGWFAGEKKKVRAAASNRVHVLFLALKLRLLTLRQMLLLVMILFVRQQMLLIRILKLY